MCLCYFMQWIDKIAKYTGTKVVRENITSKHINTTSLIRSSPNTLGLCLSVQPSVVASLSCFLSRVFTIVSSIWVWHTDINQQGCTWIPKSLEYTNSLYWYSTSIGHSSMSPIWDSYRIGITEECAWTSQAFSGAYRLSDSLCLYLDYGSMLPLLL